MITVVVPAFNAHADLPRALTSICMQTWSDWQCVVVDDGSTPPLRDIVEELCDVRIRVVRHDVNRGRGAARQTGLAAVTTPFVAWQDADDWSYPERLAVQLDALRGSPRTHLVGSRAAVANCAEALVGVLGRCLPEPHRLDGHARNRFAHPTLLFRREVLDRFPYRAHLRTSEDHDFMMRALRTFDFAELPDILYVYREEQSRSLRKYYASTRTRLRVAATLKEAPLPARARLVAGYVAKLAVVTVASLTGTRDALAAQAHTAPTPEDRAAYDARRRQLDARLGAS